jgi:hypothetical protein
MRRKENEIRTVPFSNSSPSRGVKIFENGAPMERLEIKEVAIGTVPFSKNFAATGGILKMKMVEAMGIEPTTPYMPWKCSPS